MKLTQRDNSQFLFILQNEEIATEGELRSHSVDDNERVRDLQDKVADLQAEVCFFFLLLRILCDKIIAQASACIFNKSPRQALFCIYFFVK